MGLDIWFAEDIRNALLAANEASAATAAVIAEVALGSCRHNMNIKHGAEFIMECTICWKQWSLQDVYDIVRHDDELLPVNLRVYREGYKAALATIALAFGLSPQALQPPDCVQPWVLPLPTEEKDEL